MRKLSQSSKAKLKKQILKTGCMIGEDKCYNRIIIESYSGDRNNGTLREIKKTLVRVDLNRYQEILQPTKGKIFLENVINQKLKRLVRKVERYESEIGQCLWISEY